jgi:hypothetical protein
MRCGTLAALRVALTGVGLSGRLNTAFVERVKKDAAPARSGPGSPKGVDCAGRVVAECRMVDTCAGGNASDKWFTLLASGTSICAGFLHYSAIRTDVSRSHA